MKKEFRKNVIDKRKSQNLNLISKKSHIIAKKILQLDCVKNAKTIMLYLDFDNEVQTNNLIKELISSNKIVACPVTLKEERKLIPYQILNLENGIKIGAYNIREPKVDECLKVDISDIDIVIVPAVAYDVNCYRLGYGGGFYDRFLQKLNPNAKTIGIAFDFQIFDEIPKESHDAKLDFVVTESKIYTSQK